MARFKAMGDYCISKTMCMSIGNEYTKSSFLKKIYITVTTFTYTELRVRKAHGLIFW